MSTLRPTPPHRFQRLLMGTVASIHVHDDVTLDLAAVAVASAWAELARLETIFSTFRASSEISRVNRGDLSLLDCSREVIDVMDACTWLEHASDGAFCVRPDGPGGRLDPAGFVKGWAAERAAGRLLADGLSNWYLAVGGDLLVHGSPRTGEPGTGEPGTGAWTIAIADPLVRGGVATALRVTEGAVATSGTAERGAHLWDAQGRAVDAFASVTVLGPSLAWADAFATTICAMGPAGLEWIERFDGYRAFAVTHGGQLVNTTTT